MPPWTSIMPPPRVASSLPPRHRATTELMQLPVELLTAIAGFATVEVLAILRRVSKAWKDIVDRDSFCPFRKAAVVFDARVKQLEHAVLRLAGQENGGPGGFTQGTQVLAAQAGLLAEAGQLVSRLPPALLRRIEQLPPLPLPVRDGSSRKAESSSSQSSSPETFDPALEHILRFFMLPEWSLTVSPSVRGTRRLQDSLETFFQSAGKASGFRALFRGLVRRVDLSSLELAPYSMLAAVLLFMPCSGMEVEALIKHLLCHSGLDWISLSEFLHAFVMLLKLRFHIVPRSLVQAWSAARYVPPAVAPTANTSAAAPAAPAPVEAADEDMFPPLGAEEFDAAEQAAVLSQANPEQDAAAMPYNIGRITSIGRVVHDVREGMRHFEHYQVNGLKLADGGRPLTEEQQAVVNFSTLGPGQLLLVLAYAGTGKTTTLMEFARRRRNETFLYVAFNRDIAQESKTRFPPNVSCRTMHSLALEFARSKYGNKIEHNDMPVEPVCRLFKCTRTVGSYIIQTISRFCWKIRTTFNEWDVPAKAEEHYKKKKLEDSLSASQRPPARKRRPGDDWEERVFYASKPDYVKMAQELWQRIMDPNDTTIKMFPEAYLKYACLENFQLGHYDWVFFDEVQDASEVMVTAIKNQRRNQPDAPRKVVVGDLHQRIYGWRGAVTNLMETLKPDAVLRLTNSFRFDIGIADIASSILTDLKDEAAPLWGIRKRGGAQVIYNSLPAATPPGQLNGAGNQGQAAAGPANPASEGPGPASDPMDFEGSQSALSQQIGLFSSQANLPLEPLPVTKITYICRTNHHVLLRAVRLAAQNRHCTLGCTISRANLQRMVTQLCDAYYLRKGLKNLMKGPLKYWYATWQDFERDLEDTTDQELHTVHEVVEDLKDEDAPRLLRAVESRIVDDHREADFIFTTLHKAKGLEFEHVELTNDFIDLNKVASQIIKGRAEGKIPHSEGLNCLYVAITRAQKGLGVNPSLSSFLEANLTGSNRWVLEPTGNRICDRCLGDESVLFNNSLHPDRKQAVCLTCAEEDADLCRDPIVRWGLALLN